MTMDVPLERELEEEVMDTQDEAADYDAIDHTAVNARFCDDLVGYLGPRVRDRCVVLDVGTGTALIPIELCSRAPTIAVLAIDLAAHMLKMARRNVARAGLDERITLERVDAKRVPYANGKFDVVVSNSIVHHSRVPGELLREMWRAVAPGGVLFVRDLARPETLSELRALVDRYAPRTEHEPPSAKRQRGLFAASLHAALTVDEVRDMIAAIGLPGSVTATSDRHWTLVATKPRGE